MDIVRLRSGTEVAVRPIRPDDGPRLRAAYDRLSPESRYRRFLAPKPHLSLSEVHYLVDADGANHLALVATLAEHPNRIVGVARFIRLPDEPRVAEFAVVIGDPWQGEGLASALLERLVRAATAGGIEVLRATMLADNVPAHRLMEHLQRPRTLHRHGPIHELDINLAA